MPRHMVFDLLYSTLLLLVLSSLYEFNLRYWGPRQRQAQWSAGLVFGLICVVGISLPVSPVEGVLLDGRTAVLAMAGFFGGPLVVLVAAGMALLYRLWLGGSGAAAGVGIIVLSAGLGLAYRHAVARGWLQATARHLLAFGAALHGLALVLVMLLLPPESARPTFWPLLLPYLGVLTPATAMLGLLLQDLEHQRQTQQALQHSEALRRAITRASPDILLVVDEDGRYIEAVAPDEGLLYANHVVGKNMADVLPPDEARRFLDFVRHAIVQRTPQVIEYDMHTLNGPHVFEARAQALDMLVDGKHAALFVARDITERVAAEQERRIAAIAFEAQQGMVITDANAVILRVNHALALMSGYSPAELVGQHTRVLQSGRHDAAFYQALWHSLHTQDRWSGEIWNRRKNGEVFPVLSTITAVRDAHGHVTHYVAAMNDITERQRQDEEIRHLAFYDQLTAVPNRRLLLERLQQALARARRQPHGGALMFIDLDDFKRVNDVLGHQAGDVLLQQVASRLSRLVRDSDTVARQGGDEFVVLLEQLHPGTAHQEAAQVADKILHALSQPYDLNGEVGHVGASIGVALFGGHSATGPAPDADLHPDSATDALMRRADQAMYAAKQAGKNSVVFACAPAAAPGGATPPGPA